MMMFSPNYLLVFKIYLENKKVMQHFFLSLNLLHSFNPAFNAGLHSKYIILLPTIYQNALKDKLLVRDSPRNDGWTVTITEQLEGFSALY